MLQLLAIMATATAAPSTAARRPGLDGPKNALSVTPTVNAPRLGIGLGYDRAVHRNLSVGVRFEYAIPRGGYAHIQGLTETLALGLWAPRAFRGFFAEASLGLAHSLLAVQPKFRHTSIIPGLSAGLRWRFGKTFFLGTSVGLRWGQVVRADTAICTYRVACPATRPGPWARIAADIGFAF